MSVDDFGNWDPGPLERGERLFIDTGENREVAVIDYSLTEDRYIVSYREAGEVLTTHVMQRGMSDLLVFPILFAYRHWLELELKALITLGIGDRDGHSMARVSSGAAGPNPGASETGDPACRDPPRRTSPSPFRRGRGLGPGRQQRRD
jgi:hypothetical protein